MASRTYQAGCNLTDEMVRRFKIFGSGRPDFVFPPKGVGLIASIADVGQNLARNDAARELVAQLMKECDRRKLNDYPTAMMLMVCLERNGIPVRYVPFEELGIKGRFVPMGGDAGNN